MSYLVKPLRNKSLSDCRSQIQAAHDYLAEQARRSLAQAQAIGRCDHWGSSMKRLRVVLSAEGRPEAIPEEQEDHNLTEVYNQCATMERLLDAINWTILQPRYAKCRVRRCHPTTSCDPGEEHDNDLLLEDEHGTLVACFEVSDIVSRTTDSNQKERKDLVSLGALRAADRVGDMVNGVRWPEGHSLYLVVSEEFADYLRRPARFWLRPQTGGHQPPHCRYTEVKAEGPTRIFRVDRGEK